MFMIFRPDFKEYPKMISITCNIRKVYVYTNIHKHLEINIVPN